MCRPTTCKRCGNTTWSGCGNHVDQVMANVPKSDRCTYDRNTPAPTKRSWFRR